MLLTPTRTNANAIPYDERILYHPLGEPIWQQFGQPHLFYNSLKRAIDLALSFIAVVMLLPIMLLIAVGIKLDDGGPILYFREIIGYRRKHFFALKFRTMILDADRYLAARPELQQRYLQNMKLGDDPRVTSFGRFLRKSSLDELPQLLNIFLGQMTLVGPRIIHPNELIRYGPDADRLLTLKPGLTGLWQISGRQHISYSERITLDMEYGNKRSTLFDLTILLKTIKVLLHPTGI